MMQNALFRDVDGENPCRLNTNTCAVHSAFRGLNMDRVAELKSMRHGELW